MLRIGTIQWLVGSTRLVVPNNLSLTVELMLDMVNSGANKLATYVSASDRLEMLTVLDGCKHEHVGGILPVKSGTVATWHNHWPIWRLKN